MLSDAFGDAAPLDDTEDPVTLGRALADALRRFVRFAAAHPELNQIMVQEGTEDSDRTRRMVDRHVRGWYDTVAAAWAPLREAGIAADVHPSRVYWVIVGAASMPFVNAPEVRALTATEPTDADWVEHHADDIIAMLLPGLPAPPAPSRKKTRRR